MANTNTEIIALLQTDPSQAIRGVLDTLYLYNPAPVNELIEQLNEALKKVGFEAIVLDSLPETGKSGTIYFVPSGGETPNVYNEYVWVAETEKFEMVGSAQVDLSNYYTKDEIDEQLIEIVGYVGDQTRPIRNDLNQLNQNTLKVANWVNAKDEEGNRAVLETEAQDAFRAINELNAKIGEGGGASLPDQTDNAGKFLTTDGENVSWGNAIKNEAEDPATDIAILAAKNEDSSILIGGGKKSSKSVKSAVAIGSKYGTNDNVAGPFAVAIGKAADATAHSSIALGFGSSATGDGSLAFGNWSKVNAAGAIQLNAKISSTATNNEKGTFKVALGPIGSGGNYKLLDIDGTIPTDRYTTTPTDAGTYVPKLTIAEDGTATREWGTESGGAGGDYLPLSGGTLTGPLTMDLGETTAEHSNETLLTFTLKRPSGETKTVVVKQTSVGLDCGGAFFTQAGDIIPATVSNTLGSYSSIWDKVHAKKICNGADLIVPTEGGTLARLEDLEDMVTIKEYD
jgi:hypothetical protein